jgi:hypothetical protein
MHLYTTFIIRYIYTNTKFTIRYMTSQLINSQLTRHTVLVQKLIVCSVGREIPAFMESEGSLPYLQQPATSPYPKPDKSKAHPPTLFP